MNVDACKCMHKHNRGIKHWAYNGMCTCTCTCMRVIWINKSKLNWLIIYGWLKHACIWKKKRQSYGNSLDCLCNWGKVSLKVKNSQFVIKHLMEWGSVVVLIIHSYTQQIILVQKRLKELILYGYMIPTTSIPE